MDIQRLNTGARLREWAEMVTTCRNSGQTVGVWCKASGINVKTYYYRLKKVCEAAGNELEIQRRNTAIPASLERDTVFAEISPAIRGQTCKAAITVQMGGSEIQIHNGADVAVIEATLRILRNIC